MADRLQTTDVNWLSVVKVKKITFFISLASSSTREEERKCQSGYNEPCWQKHLVVDSRKEVWKNRTIYSAYYFASLEINNPLHLRKIKKTNSLIRSWLYFMQTIRVSLYNLHLPKHKNLLQMNEKKSRSCNLFHGNGLNVLSAPRILCRLIFFSAKQNSGKIPWTAAIEKRIQQRSRTTPRI